MVTNSALNARIEPADGAVARLPADGGRADLALHRPGDSAVEARDELRNDAPAEISVVVPLYNELQNIAVLHTALRAALVELGRPFEMVFVDDGSTDGSQRLLAELAELDDRLRVIEFRDNFGQTAAMRAGIQAAAGDVVVTMDGDLQNDPADVPAMIARLEAGYDLVQGWRKDRRDALLTRRIPSRIANWLISKVTGFPVHDLGCSLKAIRSDVARELQLYGEMHRFIPILAHWRGARCTEAVVRHHPRKRGRSKYGLSRTPRVLFDLITVKYLTRYLVSPMKLFGVPGLACCLAGLISGVATFVMKFGHGTDMTGNPLLLLSAVSGMLGLQFFGMGMLGELGVRIYFAQDGNHPYAVRRTHNLQAKPTQTGTPTEFVPRQEAVSRAAYDDPAIRRAA